jgi:hypothetical protein
MLDARDAMQAIDERSIKRHLFEPVPVLCRRQRDAELQCSAGAESWVDPPKIGVRSDEQAAGGEQHDGESNLRDHQPVEQASLAP